MYSLNKYILRVYFSQLPQHINTIGRRFNVDGIIFLIAHRPQIFQCNNVTLGYVHVVVLHSNHNKYGLQFGEQYLLNGAVDNGREIDVKLFTNNSWYAPKCLPACV